MGNFNRVVEHFLKRSTYHHIFIDEIPTFRQPITKHDLFSSDKMYSVTMKCDIFDANTDQVCDKNMNEEWIKQMTERYNAKRILLKHNMRNSETIVNVSTCFDTSDGNYVSRNQSLNKGSVKQIRISLVLCATIIIIFIS